MFGRAIDEDSLRREAFGARREKLELADDFNGTALLAPPLHKWSKGLCLEREPMADWHMPEALVEFGKGFLDGNYGKEIKRSRLLRDEWSQQGAPEFPARQGIVEGALHS